MGECDEIQEGPPEGGQHGEAELAPAAVGRPLSTLPIAWAIESEMRTRYPL